MLSPAANASVGGELRHRGSNGPSSSPHSMERGDLGDLQWGTDRSRKPSLRVTALWFGVFVLLVLGISALRVHSSPGGACRPPVSDVSGMSHVHMKAVASAEAKLRAIMDSEEHEDTVCIGCHHGGFCGRCIVWKNGTIWSNPVIQEKDGSVMVEEQPYGTEPGTVVKKRRAKVITVQHDDAKVDTLHGADAFCVQHTLDEFDGTLMDVSE